MAFGRNPNEVNYIGGRKHWTDVLKNSGPSDMLIWRQPEEDFNDGSTLIVNPSEQAIFYRDGLVHEIHEEGKFILNTENYPILSRFRTMFTGGVSPYHCAVYFVRKTDSAEIPWGTDSRIQVRDPVQRVFTSVCAHGAYKVRVTDGVTLITQLAGHTAQLMKREDLNDFFRNAFQQRIKENIAKAIIDSHQEIVGINARQSEIAEMVKPHLAVLMEPYGIKLLDFSIASIEIPEDDPNRQRIELAEANKRVMEVLGDKWGTQQGVDILTALVSKSGNAILPAAAMQTGINDFGPALSGISQPLLALVLSDMKQEASTNFNMQPNRFQQQGATSSVGLDCPKCGATNPSGARFCCQCGKQMASEITFCPVCKATVVTGAKFCNGCGEKLL